MFLRTLFLLLFSGIALNPVWAQVKKESANTNPAPTAKKKHKIKLHVTTDSLHVRDYDNLLSVTLPFESSHLLVNLTDKQTGKVLNFRPNTDLTVGLNLGFQVLGFGYSISSGLAANSNKTYGKTKNTDYFFSFSGHRFVLDLYFEDFRGFYISNYASYPKASSTDTSKIFPQRADMKAVSAGLTFYYIQNYTRFSYKAAFGNSEEQLKSCGSLMYGGYLSTFNMNADSGLVTGKYKKYLHGYANLDRSVTLNAGLSIGYMFTFVFKHHFYATLALNPGLSYLYYQSHAYGPKDTARGSRDSTYSVQTAAQLGFKIHSRLAIGYNSPKWYGGIKFAGDAFYQDENVSKSKLDYTIGSVKVFIGYRFQVPYLNKIWPKKLFGPRINLDGTTSIPIGHYGEQ